MLKNWARHLHGKIWASVFIIWVTAGMGIVAAQDRPNVLMIWVDDLRPEFSAYGVTEMQTPNLDRLAGRSLRFDRAYCNIPVCGASRASVMSGLRGTRKRFTSYLSRADKEAPTAVTLQQVFRDHGYQTAAFGKVMHNPADSAAGWGQINDFYEWPGYRSTVNQRLYKRRQQLGKHVNAVPWEVAPDDGKSLADVQIAAAASQAIQQLAAGDEPFFIAAGFYKPHLPFVAPQKFWSLYPADQMKIPDNFITQCEAPKAAFSTWGELRSYYGMPRRGGVSRADARQLIAGYRSCVSFTDDNIGKLLDAVDASGQANNTIIVLLGDHGWNLGEHGMWCKHCCFETSMRTALLVAAPMVPGFVGGSATTGITELVDLYPTLCELTGVAGPQTLAGKSFAKTLVQPSSTHRQQAIGRYGSGDTIRTDRFRYTLYRNREGDRVGQMLFDHDADPHENNNVADVPAFRETAIGLRTRLLKIIEDGASVQSPALN